MIRQYYLQIPKLPEYPWQETTDGLAELAMSSVHPAITTPTVHITWAPWADSVRSVLVSQHMLTNPGPIVVIENGWLQPIADKKYYSVGLWGWNGTGVYPQEPDLGQRFGRQLRPVLPDFTYGLQHLDPAGPVVVVEQRGHPTDIRTMHDGWVEKTVDILWNAHGMPSIIRRKDDEQPILDFLRAVRPRGLVTWSSAVASWASVLNIPVDFAGPSIWTWELASRWDGRQRPRFVMPFSATRSRTFTGLAWTQWTAEEIQTGEPFARLLEPLR